MTSINLAALGDTGLEPSNDVVTGSKQILPSDVYTGKVASNHFTTSKNGALALNVKFVLNNGTEYSETFYLTNSKGENFYINKKTQGKVMLPGCRNVSDLCLVTTNTPLQGHKTSQTVVDIYNFELGKNVKTPVECISALNGKEVNICLLEQIKNKAVSNGNGGYEDTNEKVHLNVVDKFLQASTNLTANEIAKGSTVPYFYSTWLNKNQGKAQDRFKPVGEALGEVQPSAGVSTFFN